MYFLKFVSTVEIVKTDCFFSLCKKLYSINIKSLFHNLSSIKEAV